MGWEALQGPQWEQWLLAVAGKNRVRSGHDLDPFGTSWRRLSSQAREWMPMIASGEAINNGKGRRDEQALIDLRGAALVEHGIHTLTPFGTAVLSRWEELDTDWKFELPLAIALLQEGLARDAAGFRGMLGFWWDIRQTFEEEDLFDGAGTDALMLLPYLNQTRDGFNAWATVREGGSADPAVPWESLASPGTEARAALDRLRSRLDKTRRLKPRIVFCRAMSLMFEHRRGRGAAYLDELALPRR
jgi:hypothetical protein